MDTPGYDPVSVTGQVAGGCNVVVFTTGRGSAFGFKPAPSIKIATNTTLYANQEPDMDINAGKVLDGVTPGRARARRSSRRSSPSPPASRRKSELAGVGEKSSTPGSSGRCCRGRISSGPVCPRRLSTRRGAGSGTFKSKENRPEELGQRLLLLGIE